MNQYFTIMFAFLCGCVAFRYKFILVLKYIIIYVLSFGGYKFSVL